MSSNHPSPRSTFGADLGDTKDARLERALEFQRVSLLYYLLVRLVDEQRIEVRLSVGQDATFVYPRSGGDGITELVQCKTIEDPPAGAPTGWYAGTFHQDDLREWLDSGTGVGSNVVDALRGSDSVFFTVLMFSKLSTLDLFRPPTPDEQPAHFAVDFRHTTWKRKLPRRLPLPALMSRVRMVPLPDPDVLRLFCRSVLETRHDVSVGRSAIAVRELLDLVGAHSGPHAAVDRKLPIDAVRAILAAHRQSRGRWASLDGTPIVPALGPPLIERPELTEAWTRLAEHGFITVYGDPGTGKTTLLRWLVSRYRQAHPERAAYYLPLIRGAPLLDELQFLVRNLRTEALFAIDDQQVDPATVDGMVEVYLDGVRSSTARIQLAISSVDAELRHESKFRQAADVRLNDVDVDTLRQLLPAGRSVLSVDNLRSLSAGNIGLAIVLSRPGVVAEAGPSAIRTLEDPRTKEGLRALVAGALGRSTADPRYETLVLPHFLLGQAGLPIPADLNVDTPALLEAGLLRAMVNTSDEPPRWLTPANNRLAIALALQHRHLEREFFDQYLDRYPEQSLAIAESLREIDRLAPLLRELLGRRAGWLKKEIWERPASWPLHAIARLLRAAYTSAEPELGRDLLRTLCFDQGLVDAPFVTEVCASHRFGGIASLSALLDLLSHYDHELVAASLRRMPPPLRTAVVHWAADRLALPDTRLDHVAGLLRSLRALDRELAGQLLGEVEQRQLFDVKRQQLQGDPHSTWILLRACEWLRPLGTSLVDDLIERFFPAGLSSSLATISTDPAHLIYFLVRLRKVHRRRALVFADEVFKHQRVALEAFLRRASGLSFLVSQLRQIVSLSRKAGVRLGIAIRDHLVDLGRRASRYSTLGEALDFLQAHAAICPPAELIDGDARDRALGQIVGEDRTFHLAGRFLVSVAGASREDAQWFAERVDHRHFLGRIHSLRLLNWAYIIRGLASLHDHPQAFFSELERDHRLRSELSRGLRDARSMREVALAVSLLMRAGLSRTRVQYLVGGDHLDVSAQLQDRVRSQRSLLELARGLWTLARFDFPAAQELVGELATRWLDGNGERPAARGRPQVPAPLVRAHLAETGELLQVAGSIDPVGSHAIVAALGLDRPSPAGGLRDRNLGRYTALLAGLQRASFGAARRLAAGLTQPDVLRETVLSHGEPAQLVDFGRALGQISRTAAERFGAVVTDHLASELLAVLSAEADLPLCVRWLQCLRMAAGRVAPAFNAGTARITVEVMEFDHRARELLRAAYVLSNAGFPVEAEAALRFFRRHRHQTRFWLRLRDWIDVLFESRRLMRVAGAEHLDTEMLTHLSEVFVTGLMLRENDSVVNAFFTWYIHSMPHLMGASAARWSAALLPQVIQQADQERRWIHQAVSRLLLQRRAPTDPIPARPRPWELGLLAVIADALEVEEHVTAEADALPLESGAAWFEALPSIELALTVVWGRRAGLSKAALEQALTEAISRRDDEIRGTIRRLLDLAIDEGARLQEPYDVWVLLKETILRTAYLVQEEDLDRWSSEQWRGSAA